MKITRLLLVIILLCIFISGSTAQIKNIGIPSIVNHSRSKYNASTQNWSIAQCSKGFMYFGNNDGILEYDGTNWSLYPVPNRSVVRSVLAIGDTIYSGAFEELGYLAPNNEGMVEYHSLKHLIPAEYSNFDEIWNIYKLGEKIIFQSFNFIFILSKGEFKVVKPLSKFSMLHKANNNYYIVNNLNGLMQLKDDSLIPISQNPIFFRNEIRCIIEVDNGDLLIGASNEGIFVMDHTKRTIKQWDTDVNKKLVENNLFSALKLSNGKLAFGSVSNGVYISDENGNILQHLNRHKGLQNNTILSLFEDRRNNLWLGLDNGVDFIEISSPLSFLNYNFNIESAYATIVHRGIMYVGTNQGLYAKEFSKVSTFSKTNEGFQLIKGTEGQVWTLEIIDGELFCGHNFGCFLIEGYSAKQISDIRGFWSFTKPQNQPNYLIAGTYTGLVRFEKKNGKWDSPIEIKGFKESSRNMYWDQKGNLWIAHGYRGLFKLSINSALDSVNQVTLYRSEKGLPDQLPYNIQLINSEMYVTTSSGIFQYNYNSDIFEGSDELNKHFNGKGFIDKIHQDTNGNLWYFTSNYLGVMRLLENGTYVDITSPFSSVNEVLLPAFQNIYCYDPYNVFVGSQKGLIHYSPNIIKDYSISDDVYIKDATFYSKQKQLTTFYLGSVAQSVGQKNRVLPYSKNSISLRFTLPAFENPERIRFAYRLIGFNSNWSNWESINFKEYTNLREGNYTFQIKAINSFGTESSIKSFHFTIKPPFIRSRVAYIIYSFILLLAVSGNIYYIRKRILKTRMREKLKHEKRLAQREQMFKEQTALSEKEIVHLRNESLKSEMKFKNKELANATLHLIQKNKTLTYLKDDLSKMMRTIPSDSPQRQNINNLLKKINKDIRNEKSWELFNNYFDEVHQDFISRLKSQFDDLTPKELRLCAYLRMNISSKEIAPLMNISIRGVEISRYRLRKKLKLDHNANLTEFLISF